MIVTKVESSGSVKSPGAQARTLYFFVVLLAPVCVCLELIGAVLTLLTNRFTSHALSIVSDDGSAALSVLDHDPSLLTCVIDFTNAS